jgi:hypothetical protein
MNNIIATAISPNTPDKQLLPFLVINRMITTKSIITTINLKICLDKHN